MISTIKRSTARVCLVGVAAFTAAALAGVGVANAVTAFPFVDSNSINDQTTTGGISLYDANNNLVTTGSTTVPFSQVVSKAVATGQAPVGYRGDDTDASTYNATLMVAVPTGSDPTVWPKNPFNGGTIQTDPTANPKFTTPSNTPTLAAVVTGAGATQANGYYEIRLVSGDDGDQPGGKAPTYYTEDIQITGTTFTVLNPAAVTTPPMTPEVPFSVLIPIAGLAVAGGTVVLRRRRSGVTAAV